LICRQKHTAHPLVSKVNNNALWFQTAFKFNFLNARSSGHDVPPRRGSLPLCAWSSLPSVPPGWQRPWRGSRILYSPLVTLFASGEVKSKRTNAENLHLLDATVYVYPAVGRWVRSLAALLQSGSHSRRICCPRWLGCAVRHAGDNDRVSHPLGVSVGPAMDASETRARSGRDEGEIAGRHPPRRRERDMRRTRSSRARYSHVLVSRLRPDATRLRP